MLSLMMASGLALLLALLIAAAYPHLWNFLGRQDRFRIKQVSFTGCRRIMTAELEDLVPPIKDRNLYSVDYPAIRKSLLRHPWVENVAFHRRLPNRLVIEISERKPVALLKGNELWGVDIRGILLPLRVWRGPLDLPLVNCNSSENWQPGDSLKDQRILNLLPRLEGLRRRLPDLWQVISEVSWDQQGQMILFARNCPAKIMLGAYPNWEQMLNFYSFLIYQEYQAGLHSIVFVDLRFPGQVIIRRNQSNG